ncbi:MAG: PAS domain S-box protein [Chloroflexales bacterium]|nr:PAS domain S-box protein [Chloroflexales bacterium]
MPAEADARPIAVLLIEGDPSDALALREVLIHEPRARFTLAGAERLDQGLDLLGQQPFDIALLDLDLPDSHGLATFEQIHRRHPDLPVVVFSGIADEQAAVTAVQSGAQDYIIKGPSGWALAPRAIRYALERHQAQATIRASERRFRAMIENSADVIALVAADGTILYESPSVTHMLGYQPEEMLGHNAFEYVHPDDSAATVAALGQLSQQAVAKLTMQLRYRRADGTWCWIEASAANLLHEPGVQAIVINYRDVSESKQAQYDLLLAQQFSQATIDALSAHICVLDADGRIISVNRAWRAFAEANPPAPAEACIGMNYLEVCDHASGEGSENAHAVAEEIRKILRGEARHSVLEYPCHSPDEKQWFTVSVTRFADDGPARLAISHENVTERKRAEHALANERAQLRTLINTIPDMIWLKDDQGVYLSANPTFERFVGRREANLVGKTDFDLFEPELAEFFRYHDRLAIQADRPSTNEEWVTFADDGHHVLLETTKTPMFDPQGQLFGVLGIARDITERKATELVLEQRVRERTAELEAIRRRLELATRAAGLGIWDWDIESDQLVWDDQMFQLYGLTRDSFDGSAEIFHRSMHPDDILAQLTQLDAVLRNELEYDSEFRVIWADRSEHHLKANAVTLLNERGQVARLIGVNYDITVRKQAEALLRNSEEMLRRANSELERAMRMKDEFLASMSHELRTPLNGILGFSEAMQEQIYGALNERQLRALATIESSGRHLLALINDILDISKMEAGKLELQSEPCVLDDICQTSLQLVRGMAQKKQQRLNFTMSPAQITIYADLRRLKQILVNLLSNAIKFTPEHGALGLDVQGDAHSQTAQLTVWDTGIGIGPEDMKKLFRPFVQLDSSLSRQNSGTGLGLSLVLRLAELHGGSVRVESTPAEGSRFTVVLPWATVPANQAPLALPPGASPPQRGISADDSSRDAERPLVMVVDDNEFNVGPIVDYLEAKRMRVVPIRSGWTFLEQAPLVRPDVVLLSLQIPGIDGLEVTRRLRAHADPGVASIPIIAITALSMPGDRERCLAAGATMYLSKPIRPQEIVSLVRDLRRLGGHPTTEYPLL